jgi:DNA-binding winged helix-turn-helix (wHTH) protein/tetratricopeptide (TPR) repeat protein
MSLEISPSFVLNSSVCHVKSGEKHFYRFKSFRLNVEERQLFQNNSPVALTPKAFDVLALLVESNGHLVGKDELLASVWGDSFVEEQNITRIIHTLRKTLGEEENGNKFIETVAKKGYRFVAKVTEVREMDEPKQKNGNGNGNRDAATTANVFPEPGLLEGANAGDPTPPISSETPPALTAEPRQRARIILFTVGFLTAVCLLVLLSFNFRSGSAIGPNKVTSIAVLPTKPVNTAQRDEVYETGIAESLIHTLGSMKGFIVRPLSATRQYSDIEQDPLAAGREQKVDYVLASNYQIADGKIRITSQLFNVATGQTDETSKSEMEIANVFVMQDAIAGEVGNKLARFFGVALGPTAKRGTTHEEAYRLYLQGMILVNHRKARKAIENFEQAVTLDPNYALAWAGIAHAHLAASFQVNPVDINEEYQKTKEAFTKALELDANLSEAYSAMCESKYNYEYDFVGAERACRRALELSPNSPVAHNIYSRFLASHGRHDEAIAEIKTAIDLDPTSYFNQRVYAIDLYFARRYEEAVAQYKRMIEMNEEAPATYQWLIRTLEAQGNESEAFEWFLKSLTLQKQGNETIQRFKTAYQRSGWQGVLLERSNDDTNYFRRAGLYARLGNKDKAFEYLEGAYQQHSPLMGSLQVEPQFDPLRDDPRFDELLTRVGLK